MANRLNWFLCMNRNPIKELQSLSSLLLKAACISPVISRTCSQIWTKFYCQDLLLTRHEVLHLVWLAQPLNSPGVAGQFLRACPPCTPCAWRTPGSSGMAGTSSSFSFCWLLPVQTAWISMSQFQIQFSSHRNVSPRKQGMVFSSFCSLMYSSYLEQCLIHERSVEILGKKQEMN